MKVKKFRMLPHLVLLASLNAAMSVNAAALNENSHAVLPSTTLKQSAPQAKPNIIYVVLDDMGYSDFGCYGSEIKTPNIDQLAANGLRYNDFNVCPLSSPTRASLLTGRDNHAVGMASVANSDRGPASYDYRGRVYNSAATVAQLLKGNGYSTLGVGKWHLAPAHQMTPAGPFDYWPLSKGFERFYGYLDGETDQFDPQLIYDNHMVETPKKAGYQFSEDIMDHAIQFVNEQTSINPDKPYFLYVAFSAVHSPLQAPKKYIDRYKGVYDKGWDKIREERFNRQKQLGIIPSDAELMPRDPAVKAWNSLSADEKQLFTRYEQTYAGYLTYADEQLGRLTTRLKEMGQFDNTIIVVISDNGATASGEEKGSDNFAKSMNHVKQPVKDQLSKINEIGGPNSQALYPQGWAMVSNTPFKGYKVQLYNGGVRTPLIIHWPTVIQAKGEIRSQYVHVSDITPTMLDLLHVEVPQTFEGVEQLPIDGVSIADTFANADAPTKHKVQYYELFGNRSIYKDGWKAIAERKQGQSPDKDKWELYNLTNDFAEQYDVASQNVEKVKELQDIWLEEAQKHGATIPGNKSVQRKGDVSIAANNRSNFKYYSGVESIGSMAAPKIQNRSYTITVPITRSAKSEDGVLAAMGDQYSGYTLYIKNNRFCYEYNYFGTVYAIESKREVPIGECTLKFEFKKDGESSGTGNLYIDDELNGEVEMPKTANEFFTFEPLDIGRDTHSPVSKAYGRNEGFRFKGHIEYVTYELQKDK